MRPSQELVLYRSANLIEARKVVVMQAKTAGQFPDPLDGIEVGAVRGQVVQREDFGLGLTPRQVKLGMMIFGVVGDDDDAATATTTGGFKVEKERGESLAVKDSGIALDHEPAGAQIHRPEVANALAGGMMEANRVFDLGGDPHPATRAVLLKVDFIQRPEFHLGITRQEAEFFCVPPCAGPVPPAAPGHWGQSWGPVCAGENATGEKAAGTGGF